MPLSGSPDLSRMSRHPCLVETPQEFAAGLRAAEEFASSLVGLDGREAKDAAARSGYPRSQVITPDVEAVTADLDPFPIRLFVDDQGVVVRAKAG
jgi:hypothetical protein